MKVNQVNIIINSLVTQMLGTEDVTPTDLTNVIQLGHDKLADTEWSSTTLNNLVDRIGKTIISQRQYTGVDPLILSDAFTFGAILQKIYIEPMKAEESKVWGRSRALLLILMLSSRPKSSRFCSTASTHGR